MLAVAFALRGTLVTDLGLERATLEKLVAEIVAQQPALLSSLSPSTVATRIVDSEVGRGLSEGGLVVEMPGDRAVRVEDIAARLAEMLSHAGAIDIHASTLSARYRQLSAALVPELLPPRDDANATLDELKRLAIPTAMLTNAIGTVARRAASQAVFGGLTLCAEDIGFAKPDRGAFEALVRGLRLPAERIFYIDAEPGSVVAAKEYGLTTVWLDPEGRPFPSNAITPNYAIRSLRDVLPILAEPYTRGLLDLRYVLHAALDWRSGHFIEGDEYGQAPD